MSIKQQKKYSMKLIRYWKIKMEKHNILIVDDESINILVLVEILSEKYNLLVATNGITAMEIVKLNENIDLVLLDLVMLEMNGYEVARQLQPRQVPFIFLTARSDPESIIQGFQEGAIDYVSKPFAKEELLARIHNHLQLRTTNNELKAVKERLEYAIHGTNDGLWDWNIKTLEVYFSPRLKEMIGYQDGELPNEFKTWEERVHPDDIESAKANIALCHSKQGLLYSNVYRMRHKNGSFVWIWTRGQTIFDAEGKPVRMVGFHTDITIQKTLERELLNQKEMMIVQSRHAAMGEMISMIAHQWRQPLTAISTTIISLRVEQELDTLNAEKLEGALIKINNYTQHLSKTISDFSNFFKKDKTTNNIKLSQLVEDSLYIIGSILTTLNIRLYREYQCEEEITTYSNEFIQVLLNIFKNAQDVLEEKKIAEPTITIKTYKENDKYCISIEDNAGGIPDTIINKIFEPYFTTKESLNGTGLGLYMSKIIIHEHCNGTIEVKNTDYGALVIISVNGSI